MSTLFWRVAKLGPQIVDTTETFLKMTIYNKQIGSRLREARRKLNLSQSALGKIFSLHKSTISKYENGDNAPDIEFLNEFVTQFKINADWLIIGEPPIFKSSGPNPDIDVLLLKLLSSIKETVSEPTKDYISGDLKISVDQMTEETPENFVLLLDYMSKHPEARKGIFKYFHLFVKPAIDKTID